MKQVHHVEEHSNFIKSALITASWILASWILAKLGYFREKRILLLLLVHLPIDLTHKLTLLPQIQ